MSSLRTKRYVLQRTGPKRKLPCQGQDPSNSKFQSPEHVFTSTKFTTTVSVIGMILYLIETGDHESFVVGGRRPRAYLLTNQKYYHQLIKWYEPISRAINKLEDPCSVRAAGSNRISPGPEFLQISQ